MKFICNPVYINFNIGFTGANLSRSALALIIVSCLISLSKKPLPFASFCQFNSRLFYIYRFNYREHIDGFLYRGQHFHLSICEIRQLKISLSKESSRNSFISFTFSSRKVIISDLDDEFIISYIASQGHTIKSLKRDFSLMN